MPTIPPYVKLNEPVKLYNITLDIPKGKNIHTRPYCLPSCVPKCALPDKEDKNNKICQTKNILKYSEVSVLHKIPIVNLKDMKSL